MERATSLSARYSAEGNMKSSLLTILFIDLIGDVKVFLEGWLEIEQEIFWKNLKKE